MKKHDVNKIVMSMLNKKNAYIKDIILTEQIYFFYSRI